MLYRKFYDELVKWHKQEKKLALLIDGARQIGKTTLIRQFYKQADALSSPPAHAA